MTLLWIALGVVVGLGGAELLTVWTAGLAVRRQEQQRELARQALAALAQGPRRVQSRDRAAIAYQRKGSR